MKREQYLLKSTLIITIGKICTQLVTFFLLPLYTSILTVEEFGVVDLINTIVSFIIPLFSLQIDQAIFRKLVDYRKNKENVSKVVITGILILLLQILIYLALFWIINDYIKTTFKIFIVLNVIILMITNFLLQTIRGLGSNKSYSVVSFITALSILILYIIFVAFLKMGARGMLLATFLGNLFSTFVLIILIIKKVKLRFTDFSIGLVKEMYHYSIPLVPNAISWWIFNSSDRIIVNKFLGLEYNGLLSASYKFSNIYISLYNVFNMTWTETASLHIKDKDRDDFFNNIINKSFILFTSIALVVISIIPIIFPYFINSKFIDSYYQIYILIVASIFNVLVGLLSGIYIAKNDTKAVAKTSIIGAIINIIINVLLINYIGLYAASISTLMSYLIMAIYRYLDVKKYINLRLDFSKTIIMLINIIFLGVTYYMDLNLLNIFVFFIEILIFYILNKKLIIYILNILKNKILGASR